MRSIAFILISALPVLAHGLVVTQQIEEKTIRVVAKYDDGTPAAQAKVMLRDSEKKVLAEAITDDAGHAVLARPETLTGCTIRVETADLHAATVKLKTDPQAKPEEPPNRWLMTVLGIAFIAGLAVIARLFLRQSGKNPQAP